MKIEITDGNNSKQNIYFPNYPFFSSLSGGLRDQVMKDVARSTHRDKIVSLLCFTTDIKQIMEESYQFEKCEKMVEKNMQESYKYAAILSVILCLYITFFYDVYIEYGGAEFTSSYPIIIVRFLISLVHLWYSYHYFQYWKKLRVWYKASGNPFVDNTPQIVEEEVAEEPEPEPSGFKKILKSAQKKWA